MQDALTMGHTSHPLRNKDITSKGGERVVGKWRSGEELLGSLKECHVTSSRVAGGRGKWKGMQEKNPKIAHRR